MDVIALTSRQPSLDPWCLMGGLVVHDDVDVEIVQNAAINLLQEVEKLGRPMTLVAFADDKP